MTAILALRGFYLNGKAVAKGAVVEASALDAGEAVSTGRAQFVSDSDQIETLAAVQKYREKNFPLTDDRGSYWKRSHHT